MAFGEQLGALQVAEEHLGRASDGVHAQHDVLQVRLQDHAVVEVGGQHRRQVGAPPVERLGGPGAVQQLGDVRGAGRVLVGDGGCEQRGHPGAQDGCQALADDQAEALVQRRVRVPVGARQREGTEGRLAKDRGAREPPAQLGAYRGEQPSEGDRAGQLVTGVFAKTVGDPDVEAELEEGVGAVQGAHRGGRGERSAAGAQIEHVAPFECRSQPGIRVQQPVLPWVRTSAVAASSTLCSASRAARTAKWRSGNVARSSGAYAAQPARSAERDLGVGWKRWPKRIACSDSR